MKEDTNPGIGVSRLQATEAPRPPSRPRAVEPSLLTTQVGLGIVRVPAVPNAPKPLSGFQFMVRPGSAPGELILTAMADGDAGLPGVPTVRLLPSRVDDLRAIDAFQQ